MEFWKLPGAGFESLPHGKSGKLDWKFDAVN
jgi:hypothetical protein